MPFDRMQQYPGGWTPDARHVIYSKRNRAFNVRHLDDRCGHRQSTSNTGDRFQRTQPRPSPDGQWLAYVSDASGREEVYLRSFPSGEWQVRLSRDGGQTPAWRKDGKEFFYYQPDGAIMAVQIATGGRKRAREPAGSPVSGRRAAYRSFAVAPDGQRFLLNLAEPDGLSPPDEIVVDWTRLLKK